MTLQADERALLEDLIARELKPYVKKIDRDAFYAESFLRALGAGRFFRSAGRSQKQVLEREAQVVKEVAKTCMTTAFCLWCHLAALTYVRTSANEALKATVLDELETGRVLGATGLSNPMKYYAGLEKLHLSAKRVAGGYSLSGVLPSVSNLGEGHVFGVLAEVNSKQRVMCLISCAMDGLMLKEKNGYFGINGSATYSCSFTNVFVPDQFVLAADADSFIEQIRPFFIAYQIPLGLGVTATSIQSIEKMVNRQNGCNQFLPVQAPELRRELAVLQEQFHDALQTASLNWVAFANIRLQVAYVTLKSVQAAMLHHGSAGYLEASAPARRLREAYFFANLTPTIKHLEKLLQTEEVVTWMPASSAL